MVNLVVGGAAPPHALGRSQIALTLIDRNLQMGRLHVKIRGNRVCNG